MSHLIEVLVGVVSLVTGLGIGRMLGYHDGWMAAFDELQARREDPYK